MALTLADAEKFAREGGYGKFGSVENWQKGTTAPVPKPTITPPSAPSTTSNPSYGPPSPGSQPSSPAAPPQRWNVDADYQTRLNQFGSNRNDAQNELLAVKDMYNKEKDAGVSNDRLGQIHDWARQVRAAAGIPEDDVTYGNGEAKAPIYGPPAPSPTSPNQVSYSTPQTGSGYTPPPPPKSNYDDITETIRKNYMADLGNQTAAINQALQQALQANELAVGKNKQALEEQIRALTQAKMDNDNQAQQLQNRRGGFYSGGLDFQLGNIAKASTQAQENVTRDVTERNADIYGRNALLAQQAADNIQRLQSAAPDKIRELIRQAINDEKQFGLQEGALTGNYNNQRTLAGQQFDWGKETDTANLTGMFNNNPTMAMQNMLFNQNLANKNANWNAYKDSVGMTGNLGSGPKSDWGLLGGTDGQASFQGQQFQYQQLRDQIADKQYQQKFDEDVRRYGLEYAADQAYKNAQITNMNADNARTAENDRISRLYKQWETTGKAPAGIPGIAEGTDLYDRVAARESSSSQPMKSTDYKTNPDFADDIAYAKKNPAQAAQEMSTNPDQFIKKYGYEGYKQLEEYINSLMQPGVKR